MPQSRSSAFPWYRRKKKVRNKQFQNFKVAIIDIQVKKNCNTGTVLERSTETNTVLFDRNYFFNF